MKTIKLSFENWLIRMAEMCIDWFMNLFADPEYYWVAETYPAKQQKTITRIKEKLNTKQKVQSEYILPVVNKACNAFKHYISNELGFCVYKISGIIKRLKNVEFFKILKFLNPIPLQGTV